MIFNFSIVQVHFFLLIELTTHLDASQSIFILYCYSPVYCRSRMQLLSSGWWWWVVVVVLIVVPNSTTRGRVDDFFNFSSPFCFLLIEFHSIFLSYFILVVPMRKCLEKHSCMNSSFPIAYVFLLAGLLYPYYTFSSCLRLVLQGWGLWTDKVCNTLSQPCTADLF